MKTEKKELAKLQKKCENTERAMLQRQDMHFSKSQNYQNRILSKWNGELREVNNEDFLEGNKSKRERNKVGSLDMSFRRESGSVNKFRRFLDLNSKKEKWDFKSDGIGELKRIGKIDSRPKTSEEKSNKNPNVSLSLKNNLKFLNSNNSLKRILGKYNLKDSTFEKSGNRLILNELNSFKGGVNEIENHNLMKIQNFLQIDQMCYLKP